MNSGRKGGGEFMTKLLDLDLKFSSTYAKDNQSAGVTYACRTFNDCMTIVDCPPPPERTRSEKLCTLGGPPYHTCHMNPWAAPKE